MFGLFEFGNSLGIDFGQKAKLAEYQGDSFVTESATDLNKSLLENFSKSPVIAAIRSDKIEIKFITIDENMNLEEITKMVELEFSNDNSVVQQEIVEGVSERYVIGMSIAKSEIEDKLSLCRKSGLDLQVIETEFHANIRYLYYQYPNLEGTNLLLDIGRDMTDLVITSEKELKFVRVFEFGGEQVTEKLAKINEISLAEAENKKNNNLEKEELKIVLEELRSQIYHSIDYYQSKYKTEINKMFLTGGSSNLKGLKEYLERQIGITTKIVADPFFSVAKGLAMREVD